MDQFQPPKYDNGLSPTLRFPSMSYRSSSILKDWGKPSFFIAGGGFSGVMSAIFLEELLSSAVKEEKLPRATIVIADPSKTLPSGKVFGQLSVPGGYARSAFLMNRVAEKLSPFPADPGHFGRWFKARTGENPLTSVPTRYMYGEYLHDLLMTLLGKKEKNVSVHTVLAAVEAVEPQPDRAFYVYADDRSQKEAGACPTLRHRISHFVDATGHQVRLENLPKIPGFFPSIEKFLLARPELQDSTLALIGFGASTLDLLRAIGFENLVKCKEVQIVAPHSFESSVPSPDPRVARGSIRLNRSQLRTAIGRESPDTSYGNSELSSRRNELVILLKSEEYETLRELYRSGKLRWINGRASEHGISSSNSKISYLVSTNKPNSETLNCDHCVWCPRWSGSPFLLVDGGYCPQSALHTSLMVHGLAEFTGHTLHSDKELPVAIVGPQALDNFFWGVRRIGKEVQREMKRLVDQSIIANHK